MQEVEESAMRSTIEWGKLHPNGLRLPMQWSPDALEDAYKRCGTITADYAKTFYLVSMTPLPGNQMLRLWDANLLLLCRLQAILLQEDAILLSNDHVLGRQAVKRLA